MSDLIEITTELDFDDFPKGEYSINNVSRKVEGYDIKFQYDKIDDSLNKIVNIRQIRILAPGELVGSGQGGKGPPNTTLIFKSTGYQDALRLIIDSIKIDRYTHELLPIDSLFPITLNFTIDTNPSNFRVTKLKISNKDRSKEYIPGSVKDREQHVNLGGNQKFGGNMKKSKSNKTKKSKLRNTKKSKSKKTKKSKLRKHRK